LTRKKNKKLLTHMLATLLFLDGSCGWLQWWKKMFFHAIECFSSFSSFLDSVCMMIISDLVSVWIFFSLHFSYMSRFSHCPWNKHNKLWTSFLFKFSPCFTCFICKNHFKLKSFFNFILCKFISGIWSLLFIFFQMACRFYLFLAISTTFFFFLTLLSKFL
jgi:hypothetical protein